MATVDDKIADAMDSATTDISAAVAADIALVLQILQEVVQALGALQSLHPMAPTVLGPRVMAAQAGLDEIRAKMG